MLKAALIGTLLATSLATSLTMTSPAQAGGAKFGIHLNQGQNGSSFDIHFNRHRRWVSPRQIRRTVRWYGCYRISPVRQIHRRYKVTATCDGLRVRMIFSARSGRLLRERVIWGGRRWRGNHYWRG